jgi:AcrR family transcriptional regulator
VNDPSEERRGRMTGQERRAQLLNVGRSVFATVGYEAASIEEIAKQAKITKPVVYEHFGGKEGLYAVVVDREVRRLVDGITAALEGDHPKELLEQAALGLLTYIEEEPDGFKVLLRDSPVAGGKGSLASVIGDIATQVEHILAGEFKQRGYDPKLSPIYSRALVGMVVLVGEWWQEVGKPKREVVAAHLVNLAWNGLKDLQTGPELSFGSRRKVSDATRRANRASG